MLRELQSKLPTSLTAQRMVWARRIVKQQLTIADLAPLLYGGEKVCRRFCWLLSDIGLEFPAWLRAALPDLWTEADKLEAKGRSIRLAFASWWRLAGVPKEQEGLAYDHCLQWLHAAHTDVTTKSRALMVLLPLVEKHPDLLPELRLVLNEVRDTHSASFRKQVDKALAKFARDQ